MLELAIVAHPQFVSREAVGAKTGYARSTRDRLIQELKARRLVVVAERGGIKAADELF
ncbi:MAG: hypothetical protein ACOY0T_37780 [Myxococcota bacterium]